MQWRAEEEEAQVGCVAQGSACSTSSKRGTTSRGQPFCGGGPRFVRNRGAKLGLRDHCASNGPESKGFKSETCTASAYAEQSGCSFAAGDYSCYKIPAAADANCPPTAPQASSACTVAACVVCGGTTGYLDSSGASKTGYCVCPASGKWSCASAAEATATLPGSVIVAKPERLQFFFTNLPALAEAAQSGSVPPSEGPQPRFRQVPLLPVR